MIRARSMPEIAARSAKPVMKRIGIFGRSMRA
jgi:hypothetical protein